MPSTVLNTFHLVSRLISQGNENELDTRTLIFLMKKWGMTELSDRDRDARSDSPLHGLTSNTFTHSTQALRSCH